MAIHHLAAEVLSGRIGPGRAGLVDKRASVLAVKPPNRIKKAGKRGVSSPITREPRALHRP